MDADKRALVDYTRLKYYCKRNRITLAELAELVGVTRQTIRSWSVNSTSMANVWRLEYVLEVKRGELSYEV